MCLVSLCKVCVEAEYLSPCIVLHVILLKPLGQNFFISWFTGKNSDLGSGDRKKAKKGSSENNQLTGHFQSFFLISPEQTVKLVR